MFSFDEDDFRNIKDSDTYMKKIKKDVEDLNSNSEFYQWMSDEEDRIIMENTVKNVGRKEGIKEKEISIVRNMKKENISIETIKKVTGLSIEQINEIS